MRMQDAAVVVKVAGRCLGVENIARNLFDVIAHMLENVGEAVDHGVENVHHDGFAGRVRGTRALESMIDDDERARFVVANGDQAMAGENEGDRRGGRYLRVLMCHQRRGHVTRAVLDVEPAGDFDLLHFPQRGNRDAECVFDRLVLAGGRQFEIDPQRVLRKRNVSFDLLAHESAAPRRINGQHQRSSDSPPGAADLKRGTSRNSAQRRLRPP